MLSRCFLDFSVGVRASVIGLSQISSFSLILMTKIKRVSLLTINYYHVKLKVIQQK